MAERRANLVGPGAAAVQAFVLGVAYLAAALLAQQVTPSADVTPVWLATGVAIAGLLLLPGAWPAVWLAGFAAAQVSGDTWAGAAAESLGGTVGVLVGARALRLTGFRANLHRVRDSLALLGVGAIVTASVSATLGITGMCAVGQLPWSAFLSNCGFWWVSAAESVVAVAPAILIGRDMLRCGAAPRRWAELAALGFMLLLSTTFAFGGWRPLVAPSYPRTFLVFPLLMWAAVRFEIRGAAAAGLVVSFMAIVLTAIGRGPYGPLPLYERLMVVEIFAAAMAGSTLVLGGIVRERRLGEERYRESEETLRMALDAARACAWDWDEQTARVRWSEGVYELFGLRPGEFDGTPEGFYRLVHPEDQGMVRTAMAEILEGQPSRRIEFRIHRPDGAQRWMVSRGELIRAGMGQPARILGLVMDITESKELREQLLQANKMESVGRLAGGVAHDFNNILAVVNGYSDLLLRRRDLPADVRESLEEVRKAGTRGQGLTGQLLAFSRRTGPTPRVVDLDAVLAGMVRMLRRLIREDVELSVFAAPVPVWIRVDPGQLEQVVVNLALNARDAMPEGGRLVLRTLAGPGEAWATLVVEDTGAGIAPEHQPRLFEPFFTTKEPGRGTGLGLATVYGIVLANRGEIAVRSQPGQGTAFEIRLPRAPVPQGVVPEPATALVSPGGRETILLVEDEPLVRGLVRSILEMHGYGLLEAASGPQALEIAASSANPIALLLTDVVMPGMSGRQLAERLSTHRPEVCVLFMTGYTDDEVLRRGIAESGSPVLYKPFTPEALLLAVREALDTPRSSTRNTAAVE